MACFFCKDKMFGNKDYITDTQLNEALTPLLKRLRALENQNKALANANKELATRVEVLEAALDGSKADTPLTADEATGADPFAALKETAFDDAKPIDGDGANDTAQTINADGGISTFFLPAPTPDGVFTETSREEQIGKSIYELTADGNGHGKFKLLSTADAVATAMISVSQFVKPVCKVQGNTHRMPDRIVTVSPGEAMLKDGIWTVTRKAVVEFK